MPEAPGFDTLDHVADVVIRAWGTGFEETLAQACLAMWGLVAESTAIRTDLEWQVTAEGQDLEEAVVNFLNEQILLFDCHALIAAAVKGIKMQEKRGTIVVTGRFSGCRLSDTGLEPSRYYKAATYHGLKVTPELIEVTLDV